MLYPQYFLDLSGRLERNLIAFYKARENKFPLDEWEPEKALDCYSIYTASLRDRILSRNAENAESFVIDKILGFLRQNNTTTDSTLLHLWELATMTRRQRAGWLSEKIRDATERMLADNPRRHFAFFNEVTGCWLIFYFQYGGSRGEFKDEAERLTRYKLLVEMKERDFIVLPMKARAPGPASTVADTSARGRPRAGVTAGAGPTGALGSRGRSPRSGGGAGGGRTPGGHAPSDAQGHTTASCDPSPSPSRPNRARPRGLSRPPGHSCAPSSSVVILEYRDGSSPLSDLATLPRRSSSMRGPSIQRLSLLVRPGTGRGTTVRGRL
jgi:hypothetical protein